VPPTVNQSIDIRSVRCSVIRHPIPLSAFKDLTGSARETPRRKTQSHYDINIKDNESLHLNKLPFTSNCFCNTIKFPFIVGEAL